MQTFHYVCHKYMEADHNWYASDQSTRLNH